MEGRRLRCAGGGNMLKRTSIVAGLVLAALFSSLAPAFADIYGNVTCSQSPTPDCQLGAGTGGTHGGNPGGHSPTHNGGGSGGNTGSPSNGDTIVGGGGNLANCSYVPSDYQPPAGAITAAYRRPSSVNGATVQLVALSRPIQRSAPAALPVAGPTPGQQGTWYVWKCTTAGVTDGLLPAGLHPERPTGAGCRAIALSRSVGADGLQPVAAAHALDRGEPGGRATGQPPDLDVAVQRLGGSPRPPPSPACR